MNIELKFREALLKRGLVNTGDHVVIAVSGGVDSMVMLRLFVRFKESADFKLTVAHVNHKLRSGSSDRDEELVNRICCEYGLPCETVSWNFNGAGNVQDEARRFRMQHLIDVAHSNSASVIATAHHRDDQAETVLMHLMRGSGLKGLGGIPWRTELNGKVSLIRPLLGIARAEIEEYAGSCRIDYAIDETNHSNKYSRNELRHDLFPLMERIYGGVKNSLAEMADRLRDDEEALDQIAKEFCDREFENDERGVVFCRTDFMSLPSAIRRRVLIRAFERVAGSRANLNSDQISRMEYISGDGPETGEYQLPGPHRFERKYNRLYIVI